jgi:hypothetical protein
MAKKKLQMTQVEWLDRTLSSRMNTIVEALADYFGDSTPAKKRLSQRLYGAMLRPVQHVWRRTKAETDRHWRLEEELKKPWPERERRKQ